MMIHLAKRVFQCMSISHHILTVASEAQLARYNVQDSFLNTENIISLLDTLMNIISPKCITNDITKYGNKFFF